MTMAFSMTSPLTKLKPTSKPLNKKDREMRIQEIKDDKRPEIPSSFICTECIRNSDGDVVDVECHCSSSEEESIKQCCKKAIAARKEIK